MLTSLPGIVSVGDVLTIGWTGSVRRRWRITSIRLPFEIVLQPLLADGSVDDDDYAAGEFRIHVDAVVALTVH